MNKRHRTRINHKRTMARRRAYRRACQSVRGIAGVFVSLAAVISERTIAITAFVEASKELAP